MWDVPKIKTLFLKLLLIRFQSESVLAKISENLLGLSSYTSLTYCNISFLSGIRSQAFNAALWILGSSLVSKVSICGCCGTSWKFKCQKACSGRVAKLRCVTDYLLCYTLSIIGYFSQQHMADINSCRTASRESDVVKRTPLMMMKGLTQKLDKTVVCTTFIVTARLNNWLRGYCMLVYGSVT